MTRLSAATLGDVRDATVPTYDRSVPPTIVHLGVGAFARAHLAVYADDLLAAGTPATVRGVSLRSDRAERALAPQDGLFGVTTREPGVAPETRVIGSLTSVATGTGAAIDAIAAPGTRFVTLTVTEQAYADHGPGSVAAAIAAGLDARRDARGGPLVIASLDNLIDNGTVLERLVGAAAHRIGGGLDRWVDDVVRFPRSVVDRMVPATTNADLDEAARRTGIDDRAAVVAGRHRSWAIEATDGLPPFASVGAEVVDDVGPHQRRKLWLLNAPHSALAYGGLIAGHDVIATAVADPIVAGLARRLVTDTIEVMGAERDDTDAFAATALARFANPALGHRCEQVGADGSTKLPQRVLPVMARRRAAGLSSPNHALVVAGWLAAATSAVVAGAPLPVVADPRRDELRAEAASGGPQAAVRAFLRAEHAEHAEHADEIIGAFDDLSRRGLDAIVDPT